MNRRLLRHKDKGIALARIAAVLVMVLAFFPVLSARAQDPVNAPVDAPPSLTAQLEAAPGLAPTALPEGIRLPDGFTADELAAMPDRSKFAVVDYRVEGDSVHATVSLPASQSTFIASGRPDQNFAGSTTMNLGWDQSQYNAMRMLIQFDLSGLPSNAQINNATFYINQLAINPPGDGSGMGFRAQFMQQSWSAGTVDWNNANYLGGQSLPLGDIPPVIGWISGGATDVVKAWRSGQPNNGLIITGDETPSLGRWRQFYSRSIPQLAPYILVDYTANCDTAAPVATMGALPSFEPNEFEVTWSAFDPDQPGCPASGVDWYNVRYRINNGGWTNWKNQSSSTSNTFKGWAPNGGYVEFQVQAADRAGNLGAWSSIVATTVDSQPPVASVNPLPEYTTTDNFTISWSGTDNLSGIAYYNVQFNKNETGWQNLIEQTTTTSFGVTGGRLGDKFEFRVQAVDRVGNAQAWSANAQATTVIFDEPIAVVLNFNPPIIEASAPVTNVIPVSWGSIAAPGTTITSIELYYRYTTFGGVSGGWKLWQQFPGTTQTADFDYASLSLGDGLYEFYALATNNKTPPQKQTLIISRPVMLDLADTVQLGYLPLTSKQVQD